MPTGVDQAKAGAENPQSGLMKARGGAVRDIAMGLLLLTREMQHDVKIRNIVVDANVLLKDLGHLCRTGRQTTLLAEADTGFVRLIVTPRIVEEVNEHIPKYAKNVRVDKELMFSRWAEYQHSLIVIDPPKSSSDPITILSGRDPDDVPTAELIELIAPKLALSTDKDLQDLGFSQNGDWLPHVLHLSKVIERDAVSIAVRVGGAVLIVGLSEAALALARTIVAAVQRIPKRILWTLVASIGILLLVPGTRKRIASFVKDLMAKADQFRPAVNQAVQDFMAVMLSKHTEWRRSEEFLNEGRGHESTTPISLRGYAIRVLAQSPYDLTPEEIVQEAQVLGYQPRGAGSDKYLRTILRRDKIFYSRDGHRWSLVESETDH